MLLLSHPTGNPNVSQTALALAEAGLLEEMLTCIHWDPDSLLARLMPDRMRRQLERRAMPAPVRARTRSFPWLEWGRIVASRLGIRSLARHEIGPLSVDAVYRDLDRRAARAVSGRLRGKLSAVYAYEDGAEQTFAAARAQGLRCLYDLPIGYWRAAQPIYREEAERRPEWAMTLDGILDSEEKLARKDRELAGADRVFVASRFTAGTLEAYPGRHVPVKVIPYGAPAGCANSPPPAPPDGVLRAIFVGSLTQRKGISYLFDAMRLLGPRVRLTVVGSRPNVACAALDRALAGHRWIPSLTNAGVLEEMRQHDLLVFPSLFEGFGLVILEALACGLPVIATPHTGAPDVLEDGKDGFIVPIRSSEAIAACFTQLLESPPRLAAMKDAALAKSRRLAWETYRVLLADQVREALAEPVLVP